MTTQLSTPTRVVRPASIIAITLLLALISSISARADVYGRLRIIVTSAAQGKPVPDASVTLHDTAGVHADEILTTGTDGTALSPPIENHAWQVIVDSVDGLAGQSQTVVVVQDTTTNVAFALYPRRIGKATRIIPNQVAKTTVETGRGQQFIRSMPAAGANSQNLGRILSTVPGFVPSSVNAVHPRGEHASTSTYIDGFLLPDVNLGRAGGFISPEIIDNAEVMTGGYAPEYGSETAAVLNLDIRAGTIRPFQSSLFSYGSYDTTNEILTLGGQAGAPLMSGYGGDTPRRFRYFFDVNNRETANALEPPQPDDQTAHNYGQSATLFGNFDYVAGAHDTLSLLLDDSPAETEIANRSGLSSYYAPIGQGYGYGGARDANGYLAGISPNAGFLGDEVLPLPSQQALGQDIYQDDENGFGDLNYRHSFSPNVTGLFSVGSTKSRLDIRDGDASSAALNSINGNPVDGVAGTLSTLDSSNEFSPLVLRSSTQEEASGSITDVRHSHTYKVGFTYTAQLGDDEYQFIPQSQLALDGLALAQEGGPQLTPNGHYVMSDGKQVLDALGDPVYVINPGATSPIVDFHKHGYYAAGYLQDTWNASSRLVIDYGARLDSYGQTQSAAGQVQKANEAYLGPRMNIAYTSARGTTEQFIYDKLFTQPPLSQGAIVGQVLKPETFDLWETSLQRVVAPGQTAKIDYYYKNIRNQDDTGILIPYTQIGAYTTLQYQYASVHGLELSYTLNPRGGVGTGGYLAYSDSHAAPGGLNQLGTAAPTVNDHDQRTTLSTGIDYTWRSDAVAGIDFYYGSGEASSALVPISPLNPNVLQGGHRIANTLLNLRLSTAPHSIGAFRFEIDVQNALNSLQVLNFNSGFSGTRFQQGRTILLSLKAKV